MSKLQAQAGASGPWTWSDALAAAPTSDDLWVVTSPNADYIPKPPVGIIDVVLRADYPQREHNHALTFTPSSDDFERLEGATIKCLGLLREEVVRPLGEVVDDLHATICKAPVTDPHLGWLDIAMCQARDRLRRFPCTFRDVVMQVRETQRYSLMIRAYLDYQRLQVPAAGARPRTVNLGVMGAFTTNPALVQRLYSASVPVWYLCTDVSILADDRVRAVVTVREPDICTTIGEEHGHRLHRGLVGPKHFAAMARAGHTYLDISRAPLLAVDQDGGYDAPTSQKDRKRQARGVDSQSLGAVRTPPKSNRTDRGGSSAVPYPKINPTQVRGVNKFVAVQHEWMPAPLTTWQNAMAAVDLSGPTKPQTAMWGYWIPEPGLLLRPQTQDRLHRYVINWVRLRPAWLYLLRLCEARLTRVPTQWWRDILYGSTGHGEMDDASRKAQRWREIEDVFGLAFNGVDFDPSPTGAPKWFDKTVNALVTPVCRPIIWEVCELGFCHELLALDRLLVPARTAATTEAHQEALLARIFPDGGVYNLHALPSPHKDIGVVLARWPCAPHSIHSGTEIRSNISPKDILVREAELASFYVNTFFEHSGHAPIVPHRFPNE
ncbi:uncharacterized protein TRAVEDRAFT_48109 [Trametes versicolor FP-101664 SS1]|uniref:uncharacterized protein n=1 Tax=Trametes versicolor (strain FP-101664) TaxID=717944 RepID=UPI0004623F7F|nr:uncharacterized protein TRAVEDRAFT_48109 [Trametes versicolor FP-101664 SS1]EIW58974.1 hypothetical protein TRAVEDRAFT_48109 [Trametes versicolor FP-101664 SS1]